MIRASIFVVTVACGGESPAPEAEQPRPEAEEGGEEGEVSAEGPEHLQVPDIEAIPTDPETIAKGEAAFNAKGCSGCHTFGSKLVGPDLTGVTKRRELEWIERMILHPEAMTKEDPIAKELLKTHMTQMPNQGVTNEELLAILAFLQSKGG